jgi:hypothetical protein
LTVGTGARGLEKDLCRGTARHQSIGSERCQQLSDPRKEAAAVVESDLRDVICRFLLPEQP